MKWLITGGLGFIGSNLTTLLSNDPDVSVTVVDDRSASWLEIKQGRVVSKFSGIHQQVFSRPNIKVFQTDVVEFLETHVDERFDVICHLAGNPGVPLSFENPIYDAEQNLLMTIRLLEFAKSVNCHKFIFASSGAVIGDAKGQIVDEALESKPVSPYGASKYCSEIYLEMYSKIEQIDSTALRFSNIYGAGSIAKSSVVAEFCKNAITHGEIVINGDGTFVRDFMYVDDLCKLVRDASTFSGFNAFNASSGVGTSIGDLASRIQKIAKSKMGLEVAIKFGPQRRGDVPFSVSKNDRLMAVSQSDGLTSLDDGLEAAFTYFQKELEHDNQ